MTFNSTNVLTTLDRILDTTADNLRVAKGLIQIGIDLNNITYDALFKRLLEIVLATNAPGPWLMADPAARAHARTRHDDGRQLFC